VQPSSRYLNKNVNLYLPSSYSLYIETSRGIPFYFAVKKNGLNFILEYLNLVTIHFIMFVLNRKRGIVVQCSENALTCFEIRWNEQLWKDFEIVLQMRYSNGKWKSQSTKMLNKYEKTTIFRKSFTLNFTH